MFRRFLFHSVGALALLAALAAPGQIHAQGMRGVPNRMARPFRGGFTTGFRSGFTPGFNRGFTPGFNRGFTPGFRGVFTPGFNRGFFGQRFDAEGMLIPRQGFNRGFFNQRFDAEGMLIPRQGFSGGFFAPNVTPAFSPGFFRPF